MTLKQAQEQIKRFIGDNKELSFTFEWVGDEWTATCNQIPEITTGGKGYNDAEIRDQVKDAIATAAGIDGKFIGKALRDVSLISQMTVAA